MPVHEKQASQKEFKCWFHYGKFGYLYDLFMQFEHKGRTAFGPGESVALLICESLKDTQLLYIYIYIYI